jgi:hypothetical protein
MKNLMLLCALLLSLAVPSAWAAEEYTLEAARSFALNEQVMELAKDPRDQLYLEDRKRQDSHTMLELVLLGIVAVATIGATLLVAKTERTRLSGRDVIRAVVMVFIIYGALALAIDVKTTETLTGVIGLLSATAGYLFGRATSTDDARETDAHQGRPKGSS